MASSKNNSKAALKNGGEKAKEILYTSVGFAAIAKEKIASLVEDLKKDGKLSKSEGEKIVKDFVEEGKKARDKYEKEVKDALHDIVTKASATTKKDFDILKKRFWEMESQGLSAIKGVISQAQDTIGSKGNSVAKTAKATVKKVAEAKTPAKKVAEAKAGAKKAVKQVTAKAPAKKAAAPKVVAKKTAAKKVASAKAKTQK